MKTKKLKMTQRISDLKKSEIFFMCLEKISKNKYEIISYTEDKTFEIECKIDLYYGKEYGGIFINGEILEVRDMENFSIDEIDDEIGIIEKLIDGIIKKGENRVQDVEEMTQEIEWRIEDDPLWNEIEQDLEDFEQNLHHLQISPAKELSVNDFKH